MSSSPKYDPNRNSKKTRERRRKGFRETRGWRQSAKKHSPHISKILRLSFFPSQNVNENKHTKEREANNKTMTKTRIGERLSQEAGHDCTKNRSAEVAAFNEKYDTFKKALFKPLSTAMKNNLTNMQKLEKSQAEVSQRSTSTRVISLRSQGGPRFAITMCPLHLTPHPYQMI